MQYCESLDVSLRLKTSKVSVGNLSIGGEYPIRVQSMTNTDTKDITATVEQCIRIAEAGAELVRITVPSVKDTVHLNGIKQELGNRGFNFPLVADVHFNPQIAEIAAGIVEKVRVNPGNYADSKKFQKNEYSDAEYYNELEKIREKFCRLITICKKHKTAIRIGTNHGSLSDRIISRYGDTPLGMAESAMEFLRICVEENFTNVVLSMKASNTIIMVEATRLLVNKMMEENMLFPLHLGVTEAGEGEDGRIKSAAGIGALLADGIGDTIRVSLTEEPENEIPVAKKLVEYFSGKKNMAHLTPIISYPINPFEFNKRITRPVKNIGGGQVPAVIGDFSHKKLTPTDLQDVGWIFNSETGDWSFTDVSADLIYIKQFPGNFDFPADKGILTDYSLWNSGIDFHKNLYPLLSASEYFNKNDFLEIPHFVQLTFDDLTPSMFSRLKKDLTAIAVCDAGFHEQRRVVMEFMNNFCDIPVIFKRSYSELNLEDFQLKSAADLGGLFIDGLGDGLWLSDTGAIGITKIIETSYAILQATRSRISKTEFISCPSCGRTNFNIIETFARIRERTAHLKGLKIGIMGCIVNGIGEMADADYGYVGAAKGRITLYKAKQVLKRNIPEEEAVEELISLIKKNGDWVNP